LTVECRYTTVTHPDKDTPIPYSDVSDLPDSVRRHLPAHAQEIYLAAFNSAWRQYAGREDREVIAHRVAWAAVKREYVKSGRDWVRK
jgi:cation transport regulator